MFIIQEKISAICNDILKNEYGVQDPAIEFSLSLEEGRGDITTSAAMQYGKRLKKVPRDIGASFVRAIQTLPEVMLCEVAGPGFVNVTLKPNILCSYLQNVFSALAPQISASRTVVLDYSAPNIAKPLGIHHILSTVIGQSLANILRHVGCSVVAINHIGDWGTQFGKLAVAYEKWGGAKDVSKYSLEDLLSLYVKFHTELESDSSLEEEGRKAFARLEQGDALLRKFWKDVIDITMQSMEHLYKRLDVHFDHTQGESFYEDKMQPIIEEGKRKNVFVPGKEGALITEFDEGTKIPPAIVLKGDGSTIYMTRDLATLRYRIDTWHPEQVLYVVDVAQSLHFRQIFAIAKKLGWELPDCQHVSFGRMSFAEKGMSTRKGNILRLEEVLDEAVRRADELIAEKRSELHGAEREDLAEMMGVGSVVYGVLSQNRELDLTFDWKKFLSFDGNSAPYIQYTYARAQSLLTKANVTETLGECIVEDLTPAERILVRQLLAFPSVLDAVCADLLPHKLTVYLYELCQCFNSFYNADPILIAEGSVRARRLLFTQAVARVLKTGTALLTLRVPDRM